MIITIDGPAGSGKSTVARKIANKLGFIHLNSGALFRAVAVAAASAGVDLGDEAAVFDVAKRLQFSFFITAFLATGESTTQLLVNGEDWSNRLSSEDAGALASKVAVLPKVRQLLLEVQRAEGSKHSLVLEGRDAGSIIFPNAEAKFYLDAPLDLRAGRRFSELYPGSVDLEGATFEAVRADLMERDRRDSSREIAPQIVPDGAIVIDTEQLGIDEVVQQILDRLRG